MKRQLGFVGLLVLMLLSGCETTANEGGSADVLLANDGMNIKELVYDYSVGNLRDGQASITSEQLIVTGANENQTIYQLPEDEFFVSFAPYISQTHPCANHSLTGCQGEMADKAVAVRIEDEKGKVIFDEMTKTQANGFVDFWLPRDEVYQITITDQNGQTATLMFSTFAGDNTCITTMQLSA